MGKRGPPATPDEIKELRGTDRKDRAHPRIVPALPGEPVMPEWLEGLGEAPDVWRGKVAKYRALGTSVVGCEDQLAQYCAFEASMIAAWRRGEEPTAAAMSYRGKKSAAKPQLPNEYREGKGAPCSR